MALARPALVTILLLLALLSVVLAGKTSPSHSKQPRAPSTKLPARAKSPRAAYGSSKGNRMGQNPRNKYLPMKATARPKLTAIAPVLKAIAVSNTTCRPSVTNYVQGSCIASSLRDACNRMDGIDVVPSSSCPRGQICCAASTQSRRATPHVTEINTRGKNAPKKGKTPKKGGKQPSKQPVQPRRAKAQKDSRGKGKGQPKGQPKKANNHAKKCSSRGTTRFHGLHFDFHWKIPAPYVAWTETEMVREGGIPIGVKIKFLIRLSVTVSTDVVCHRCGETQQFSGVGLRIEKTFRFPFKITGARFVVNALGSVIPGLNVAIIAAELVHLYELYLFVRHNVDALIATYRTASNAMKCSSGRLAGPHGEAGHGGHGGGHGAIFVIDLDFVGRGAHHGGHSSHKRAISDGSDVEKTPEEVREEELFDQSMVLPEYDFEGEELELNFDESLESLTEEQIIAAIRSLPKWKN